MASGVAGAASSPAAVKAGDWVSSTLKPFSFVSAWVFPFSYGAEVFSVSQKADNAHHSWDFLLHKSLDFLHVTSEFCFFLNNNILLDRLYLSPFYK